MAKQAIRFTKHDGKSEAERFWAKVEKGTGPDNCWIWTACKVKRGYGRFNAAGKTISAHSWAYLNLVGPIPHGWELDHRLTCERGCVRPSHITPRTAVEHALQPDSAGGLQRGKTHCKQGHEYTPENTEFRINASGGVGRVCKACHRAWAGATARRKRSEKTHCKFGHELTQENTIHYKHLGRSARRCRVCYGKPRR